MTAHTYEPAISPSKLDGTFRTLTGKKFDINRPGADMIDIQDIAAGLANQGHFNGQSPYFFSIAQHCILVCDEYAIQNQDAPDEMKLLALLHDASEAYTGDMIKPLKIYMDSFVAVENSIMQAIAHRFKLPIHRLSEIKPYDLLIQNLEYEGFYNNGVITYMDPEHARKIFVDRFKEYYNSQGQCKE